MRGTGQLPKFESDLFQVSFGATQFKEAVADLYIREGTKEGQIPKPEDARWVLRNWFLVPTAEVPVTNIVRDEIVPLVNFRSSSSATRHVFAAKPGPMARTRAA